MAESRRAKVIYSSEYESLLVMLRALRQRSGMRQADLASRLKIDQSTVSKFEQGQLKLDPVLLRDWCKALGIDFPKLMVEWDKRLG